MLRKYLERTADRLRSYFRKELGRDPYLGRLKVRLGKLPTYFCKIGDRLAVKKIFGLYDPLENEVVVDPVCFKELYDPERPWLERYFRIPKPERVLGEELIHADQANTGLMDRAFYRWGRKAEEWIEGAASWISDKLWGETSVYQEYKDRFSKLVRRKGLRPAYSFF